MTTRRMDSHQWDSSLDPEVVPLFLALQWAQSRSLEAMKPFLASHGLSMAEFDVLATLRNAPPPHAMTPKDIQDHVVITSGGLTKVMMQLESRALVERLQLQDDLRVKPVRLTAGGKALIEGSMAEMVAATGAWLRGSLAADEIRLLTTLLARIAE